MLQLKKSYLKAILVAKAKMGKTHRTYKIFLQDNLNLCFLIKRNVKRCSESDVIGSPHMDVGPVMIKSRFSHKLGKKGFRKTFQLK